MKGISFFATPKTALSANEMRQLKGGGNCGFIQVPNNPSGARPGAPLCGLTEEQAIQYAQNTPNGQWCCNDCSSRSDALAIC